jgi:hypothetical protein
LQLHNLVLMITKTNVAPNYTAKQSILAFSTFSRCENFRKKAAKPTDRAYKYDHNPPPSSRTRTTYMVENSESAEVELKSHADERLPPAHLIWKNINYEVKGRTLLDNISGSICGEVMAIMG